MAGEERDARLILRAENRASRTFDQVTASIRETRKALVDQAKAASEGTADLATMQRQLEELKNAGDDLVRGQSLVRQFQAIEEQVGKAEDRVKSATAALEAYKSKVGSTPTPNQEVQLGKKSSAVDSANASLERQQQRLAEVTQKLATAGIATDELDRDFMRMAAAAVETAQAIAQVKGQIDDYPAAVRRAAAATEELVAAQALAGKDTSFLKPGEFDFIQSLDGAKAKLAALVELEQLEARSQNAAAAAERQRRADQKAALDDVLRGNAALDAQFKELVADAQRLDDLNAFRKVGTDAAEAAVKTERYAASVQSLGNDFQSFSSAVRAALGGTSSSLQDIGQALGQIDASAAVLDKPKARINELQESSGKLAIAIATLDRTARQIDGFRIQEQAVRSAEATFAEAQAEVLRLARAVGEAEEPTEALARELEQAQRALNRAGAEMQRERNEAVKLGDALRKAGVDTDNLEAEMLKLQGGANKAGTAAAALQGKLRGRGGFLGLNAFELQNLGYQVNDVFTQLGSGTPILQIVAQQGGQIIQIFQGLAGTILRLTPLVGGLLLLFSPLIGALVQAGRATDALRAAQTLLAGQVGVSPETIQQYANADLALRNLGNTTKEATEVLQTFRDSGLDPSGLQTFAEAVDAASRGGVSLADTAKLLADALSGGAKEVENLNDKFHFLTPAEEAQIEQMIASGRESEARRILYEKFEATADRIAQQASGTWSGAFRDLTSAFNRFTSAISDSRPFTIASSLFRKLIFDAGEAKTALQDLAFFFNYASKRGILGTVGDAATSFFGGQVGAAGQAAGRFAAGGGRTPGAPPGSARQTLEGQRAIRQLTEAYEDQEKSLKKLTRAETEAQARRRALLDATGSPAERQAQADLAAKTALLKFDDDATKEAERNQKKRDAAARRDASAARAAAAKAEALANQRRSIEEQLARDLDGLDKKVADGQTASIEQRRAAVLEAYTGIFQKIDEARRKGVTSIDGQSLQQYEAQVRAQIAILQNQAEMKAREEQINETIKQRGDEIKTIQDQLERGDITPQEAIQRFSETISKFAPQVTQMTNDALTFARSLRGAVPDPKLEAFIAKLERVQQQNSGGQDKTLLKTLDLGVIKDAGDELEKLVQERDQFAAAENTLAQLGVKTQRDAQASIEAAYERTTPAIQAQIQKMRDLLAVFKDDPAMQTFYDTWIAKLDIVGKKTEYVSARYTQLKSGIDNLITQNALDAIDTIAQSFARLALGQQSAIDTLAQLGIAFAQFIAQTIIGIGKLILQALILDAVEKITGIPIGALLRFTNLAAGGQHNGGITGQDRSFTRQVPSIAFANAPRYHGGGVAGFAPDEVPAVLKRNEEVLTRTDPRHRLNGGLDPAAPEAGGDGSSGIRQILVLDPQELANAMAGPAGEKMVMTHVRKNKTTVKQMTDRS